MKKAGIIILVLGLIVTLCAGFTYFTNEKAANFGEKGITKDSQNPVNWQLYVGIGLMLIGGIVLVPRVNQKDEKEIIDSLK